MSHDPISPDYPADNPMADPTLESIEAASVVAFHEWRARHPEMNLPDMASSVFLSGFAAGTLHGAKLAQALEEKLRR